MTTVLSVLGALYRRGPVPAHPLRAVLDLGSSTDAVSLALEATKILEDDHKIVAVDQSQAMLSFSRLIDIPLTREHRQGRVWSLDQPLGPETYDAVFLSYIFEYAALQRPQAIQLAVRDILSRLSPGGVLVYAGPAGYGKKRIADIVRAVIAESHGFHVAEIVGDWSRHLQENFPMRRMQDAFNKSLFEAKMSGLEGHALKKHLKPYTDQPSIIFTCTRHKIDGAVSQVVFAAIRDE